MSKEIKINGKFTTRLCLEDIQEFQDALDRYQRQLPQVAESIITRVSDVGLEDNYKSTEVIPVEKEDGKVVGGIRTTDEGETYAEFGTGVVGSRSPHIADYLKKSGWKYDVNQHGEAGWKYYKNGRWYWTKGMEAEKKFYFASERMKEAFPKIAIEEFSKLK